MPRLALLLVLLLALAGCSTGGDRAVDGAVPGSTATASDADAGAAEVLAFTATTVQGQPFDAAAYAGQDLMVWFWAPW